MTPAYFGEAVVISSQTVVYIVWAGQLSRIVTLPCLGPPGVEAFSFLAFRELGRVTKRNPRQSTHA